MSSKPFIGRVIVEITFSGLTEDEAKNMLRKGGVNLAETLDIPFTGHPQDGMYSVDVELLEREE